MRLDAPGRVGAFGTCGLKANRHSRWSQPYAMWIGDVEVRKIRLRMRAQFGSGLTGIRNARPEVIPSDETTWSMQGLPNAESGFSRFQFRRLNRVSEACLEFVYVSMRGWEEPVVSRK